MARPTKYSADTAERIVRALEGGSSFANACRLASINPDTGYEWKKQFPEFSEKCQGARAELERRLVEKMDIAADDPKNWKAAFELLRCYFPRRYNPRIKQHAQAEVDAMMDALREQVSDEVFKEVERALRHGQTQSAASPSGPHLRAI